MSKAPEFVVTGLHVPSVHSWARVLVTPDRLSEVKESVLHRGSVHLHRGDVLEIETECGSERGLAIRANTRTDMGFELLHPGFCLVAWNGIAGDISVYSDNDDELAAMYVPIVDALFHRDRVVVGPGFIDADRITSIVVGGVTVFFEREASAKPEGGPDQDDLYRSSMWRQHELKAALEAERLNGMKLRRFKPANGSAA